MGRIRTFSDFIVLYVDGFENMTWGRPIWIIILIKLFAILNIFFFPKNPKFNTNQEKSEFISEELTKI